MAASGRRKRHLRYHPGNMEAAAPLIPNAGNWNRRDIFQLECADCRLLPICMGGCPYLYHQTGRLHCHAWKSHPDESLAVYYYLKRLEQEREIAKDFRTLVAEVKAAVS